MIGVRVARSSVASALLAGTVLTISAAPTADRFVPFHVGETLTYDVSWSTFLTAGRVTLAVSGRQAAASQSAYVLNAEASPSGVVGALYPVYYKLQTLLDARTLQPIQASSYSKERGRVREQTTEFLSATTIDYTVRTSTVEHQRRSVAAYSQDPLGAIYVLRALPLRTGQTVTVPITDGSDSYRVRVQVGALETVKTGIGTLPGWRLTTTELDAAGKPSPQRFTLWLSNDARRLPLKLEASLPVGSFVLTLASAR